MFVFSLKIPGC